MPRNEYVDEEYRIKYQPNRKVSAEKRKQVLALRRSDPDYKLYTDTDIANKVGLSKQRVYQILMDYLSPCKLPLNPNLPKHQRYDDEDWFKSKRLRKRKQVRRLGVELDDDEDESDYSSFT